MRVNNFQDSSSLLENMLHTVPVLINIRDTIQSELHQIRLRSIAIKIHDAH